MFAENLEDVRAWFYHPDFAVTFPDAQYGHSLHENVEDHVDSGKNPNFHVHIKGRMV